LLTRSVADEAASRDRIATAFQSQRASHVDRIACDAWSYRSSLPKLDMLALMCRGRRHAARFYGCGGNFEVSVR